MNKRNNSQNFISAVVSGFLNIIPVIYFTFLIGLVLLTLLGVVASCSEFIILKGFLSMFNKEVTNE